MSELLNIKKDIYTICLTHVEDKIDRSKKAMEAAQDAANSETKSSAGDKYETGRAMMQIERDRAAAQLAEGLKLQKALYQLDADQLYDTVQAGSLVITNHGNFYFSISIGKITFLKVDYFIISPISPLASKMLGFKKGDKIDFNGRLYIIKDLA